jgi:hypothetical protein
MKSIVKIALTLLVIACPFSEAAKKSKDLEKEPVKEDLPHISCSVCNRAATEIFQQTSELREAAPYKKLDEIDIVELFEKICNPEIKEGLWIRKIDIVETSSGKTSYLTLTEPGGSSKCGRECRTIAKSCHDLFEEDVDVHELSALLWKNKIETADEFKVSQT